MKSKKYPYVTIAIALVTLVYSLYVNTAISGSLFGKIKIVNLEPYGGITIDHILKFEFWRLFASQLVHVKQFHMLFNVLSFVFF